MRTALCDMTTALCDMKTALFDMDVLCDLGGHMI